jgi:hypothetical protein
MLDKKYEKINQHIKEFLQFNGYSSTLECMEAEERTIKVTNKNKMAVKPPTAAYAENIPRMYQLFEGDGAINARE